MVRSTGSSPQLPRTDPDDNILLIADQYWNSVTVLTVEQKVLIHWTRYFKLDNVTLVAVSNSSRMLGKQGNGSAVLGGLSVPPSLPPFLSDCVCLCSSGGNQLAPFGPGWATLPNSTCDNWRWADGMVGGPYGTLLGSAGWPNMPFNCGNGCVRFPCVFDDFVCVEMAD